MTGIYRTINTEAETDPVKTAMIRTMAQNHIDIAARHMMATLPATFPTASIALLSALTTALATVSEQATIDLLTALAAIESCYPHEVYKERIAQANFAKACVALCQAHDLLVTAAEGEG